MGQGSHTALPAFGYFMEKVLRDPQLAAKYRGKISDKPWPGLRVDDRPYNCQGYVAPSDTTDVDSTDVEDIDMPEEEIEATTTAMKFRRNRHRAIFDGTV